MRYALIIDGVVDTVTVTGRPGPDWVQVPDNVVGGYIANSDGTFSLPQSVPEPMPTLTPRQLSLMLMQIGMSDDMVTAQIETIEDEYDRNVALVEWRKATSYKRDHPLVASLAVVFGFSDTEMDTMWRYAAVSF